MNDIEYLSSQLRELNDYQHIRTLMTLYARAMDRLDAPLLKSLFHGDAVKDNGVTQTNAHEFADNLKAHFGQQYIRTVHHITNITIELKSDAAAVESYFIAYHQIRGGRAQIARFFGDSYAQRHAADSAGNHEYLCFGRYLDRVERRDDVWRIAHRRVTVELNHFGPQLEVDAGSLLSMIPTWAQRDLSDPVYGLIAAT